MEKFQKIFKNVIIFLAIFLVVNYLLQTFFGAEKEIPEQGNLVFVTTENDYSRNDTVSVQIKNYTDEAITIPNECPGEPFDVYKYENNEWIQKEVSPELHCEHSADIIIQPGESKQIAYESWNYALFSDLGRFRIEFTTKIEGEEKTIQTNEFIVEKESVFSQLWYGIFYKPIYNILIFFTFILPDHNLGIAIILLTLIIRLILLIPSHKALRSQKKLQDIQPRLEKVKQKYKGDQQRIAMETMAIWKEAKVNPMGSCLPLLLQMPFLIAVFFAVRNGINPDKVHLLYSAYENFTISDINVHFLYLDLTEVNTYVLPIIIGGLQFIQMKLSMARRTDKDNKGEKNEMAMAQNMMIYFMPVMIAVFTATLPAGVGMYWGTSTLFGIIQQFFINRESPDKNNGNKDEPKVRVIENN